MANDIILHIRISENSNKELYNDLLNNPKKQTKRLLELAAKGLSTPELSPEQEMQEMKQDISLLKNSIIEIQGKLQGKTILDSSEPIITKGDSDEKIENKDTISISEDTDKPVSSDAMDSLMSLLNG